MTPELIAAVLALPLPVRLALPEADPTGAGWLIPHDAETVANCYVAKHATRYEHKRVRGGAAWLPSNPLAIAEHAGTFKLPDGTSNTQATVRHDGLDDKYEAWVTYYDPTGARISARGSGAHGAGPDAHTAAVRLLAEVVGHG